MSKRALVVYGGWEGHQPYEVSTFLAELLREKGFEVDLSDTLDSFLDVEKLQTYSLISPNWTQGSITADQFAGLRQAVTNGVGLAGLHGGMGDAFRTETEYQFIVGGQWVAHPGNDGVTYDVHMVDRGHVITAGVDDFTVTSEQYYMHVDPAIHVLATTQFGAVTMPVAWTKMYGQGKVFYCSLGHHLDIVQLPPVRQLMQQGMVWAAAGE